MAAPSHYLKRFFHYILQVGELCISNADFKKESKRPTVKGKSHTALVTTRTHWGGGGGLREASSRAAAGSWLGEPGVGGRICTSGGRT